MKLSERLPRKIKFLRGVCVIRSLSPATQRALVETRSRKHPGYCFGVNRFSLVRCADDCKLALVDQRLIVRLEDSLTQRQRAIALLKDVFGVAWFAEVVEAPLDYQGVKQVAVAVMAEARERSNASTFRVTAKRANKNFELTSQQLAVRLGDDLKNETGMSVDLSNPQATLFIDVLSDRMLVYTSKERGPGGLPVGVTGKVLHLLSGGIDSPVAAWLMMKRGIIDSA